MITLESLVSKEFNFNLVYYYILYQICHSLYDHFVDGLKYIRLWIEPTIIQSFYLDSKGSTNIYYFLEYIYVNNKNRVNKDYTEHKKNDSSFTDTISPGTYIITYSGKFVVARYSQELDKHGTQIKYLSMWTISTNRNFFNQFTSDVEKRIKDECSVYIKAYDGHIYTHGGELYGLWHKVGEIPKRKLSDTILDDSTLNSLIKAFETFCSKPDYYEKYNIAYKLTVLISSSPGMGKTSLLKSLANEFGFNLYTISLNSTTDDLIPFVFQSVKKRSILVFEDVDCMTAKRIGESDKDKEKEKEEDDNRNKKSVSLSAFLNALDGIVVSEGLVVIMTTNYPEKLDPALIRQERVHLHCKLEKSVEVYSKMFKRFFSNVTNDKLEIFANSCFEKQLSLADVQAHCIKYLGNEECALFLD